MLQTYRLGNYVEALLSHGGNPQGVSRPFNNAAATHPPLLRTRGPNRILLYPGSFNPPHKGHFDLLNYVFQEAGDDLNIVAAIILPTDDGHLTAKTRNEQNPLVLEKEKRAKLWTAHGLADWAWVFDKSVEEWCGLRAQLEKAVKRDGVDLKFMLLAGPDCVSADAMCIPLYWNCTEVITSDVSRSVDFRYSQTLRQFSSYFQWEKPHYEVSKVESLIRDRMGPMSDKGTITMNSSAQFTNTLSN